MGNVRRKMIFRGIRSNLNRFLSILVIVAIGSGFMAGIAATSPEMYATADRYFDQNSWYDVDVKSTLGLTQDDVAAIAEVEGVETVQAAKVMDMVVEVLPQAAVAVDPSAEGVSADLAGAATSDAEPVSYTARVFGLFDGEGNTLLNKVVLKEGRLPANSGECVVQLTVGRYASRPVAVGDVVAISSEDASYDTLRDYVAGEELLVVGLVESPMCISLVAEPTTAGSGSVTMDVFTTSDFFTCDFYTDVYLTVAGAAALGSFDDAYDQAVAPVSEAVRRVGEARAPQRAESLAADARDQLETLDGVVDLLEGVAQTQRSLTEDATLRIQANAQVAALLGSSSPELASLLAQTGDAVEAAQPAGADASGTSAAALEAGLLGSLRTQLDQAREALDGLDGATWIVRTRADSTGYDSYRSNVGKVAALSKVFPVFFFLVALLVALTTMTRLVEENRTQIGTLKALGFTDGQILREYLLFGLAASVLGCAVGVTAGFWLFPVAIASAYDMMFTLPALVPSFHLDIALAVAPVTIGGILLATLWACYGEFRARPAVLMTPKAPPAGKRIWLEHVRPVWERLSFTQKVTCRNIFRYKKRLFMTVMGVAGCSALLVTGFGLRDSINDIVEKQYGEIYRYSLSLMLDDADALDPASDAFDASLAGFLADATTVSGWLPVFQQDAKVVVGGAAGAGGAAGTGSAAGAGGDAGTGGSSSVAMLVPVGAPGTAGTAGTAAASDLEDFIALRDYQTQQTLALGSRPEGLAAQEWESAPGGYAVPWIVLTQKLCEELGIGVGDLVTLEDSDGRRAAFAVGGIAQNYITSYAYLTAEAYTWGFGKQPQGSTVLCLLADAASDSATSDVSETVSRAMACGHVVYASSSATLRDAFADSIKSIDGVVVVLILAAGLLCAVVLYNLTNVNVCERRKELATIRVLGFHLREVERYIFRETNALSLMGALLGLGVGVWLHSFVVHTVEVDQVMFGRDIYPQSFLLALLITMVFTLLVNRIMSRQIHRVDMVEAMKAND